MKKSQIKELKAKPENELRKMLLSQKEDLSKIKIELQAKKLRNVALITNKKKMIAVISTILAERKLGKV